MSFRTNWISAVPTAESPRAFLRSSLRYYLRSYRPAHLVRTRRDPGSVKKAYDVNRQVEMDRLETLDWESFVHFPTSLVDFHLLDDKMVWGQLRAPRIGLLERLTDVVERYAAAGKTVIEFGSGDGRNLLYLKRKFPHTRFIGLELSDVSVELSRKAAIKFGLEVEFHAANVCEKLPPLPDRESVSLVFSSFALEQMPRIFSRAVDQMANATSSGLAFFEPVGELWPKDTRGFASRLRVLQLDRLRGLVSKVRSLAAVGDWEIVRMERTGIGINPLNEGCEIHLRRRKG